MGSVISRKCLGEMLRVDMDEAAQLKCKESLINLERSVCIRCAYLKVFYFCVLWLLLKWLMAH